MAGNVAFNINQSQSTYSLSSIKPIIVETDDNNTAKSKNQSESDPVFTQDGLMLIIKNEIRKSVAEERITEIHAELKLIFESIKTASTTKKKELYITLKQIMDRLVVFISENTNRYLDLQNVISSPQGFVQKVVVGEDVLGKDIKPFIDILSYLNKDQKSEMLEFANGLILNHPQRNMMLQYVGKRIIGLLHDKLSIAQSQKLISNFNAGMEMFEGIPYRYGPMGSYILRKGLFVDDGIDCIAYANILVNLTCGISGYSKNVGGMTAANMFARKPEFANAGIRKTPVVKNVPMGKVNVKDLSVLLKEYGDLFAVQIYKTNGDPYHIILVYNGNGTFKVTESDIGNQVIYGEKFVDWYNKYKNAFGYLSFSLINPIKVGDFAQGKSSTFMKNLKSQLELLKR